MIRNLRLIILILGILRGNFEKKTFEEKIDNSIFRVLDNPHAKYCWQLQANQHLTSQKTMRRHFSTVVLISSYHTYLPTLEFFQLKWIFKSNNSKQTDRQRVPHFEANQNVALSSSCRNLIFVIIVIILFKVHCQIGLVFVC